MSQWWNGANQAWQKHASVPAVRRPWQMLLIIPFTPHLPRMQAQDPKRDLQEVSTIQVNPLSETHLPSLTRQVLKKAKVTYSNVFFW